ncbi:hypothetical protein FHS51_001270 [Sphingobium wenxiniae]|uniref:Uncharacterized protein n=2 Tax=Sphingobium TaxID=165695 RepID=T0HH43_9SPHN|nr:MULTISPECIES: hypothetical protein [Sphingobium]EQA98714.1 hypothetical protein L485_16980 [Sphingobium baderi LL03]KMS61564.1 hypothetical protein V475_13465 [Sphingobium baderi LL03]MBB6191050.1 hypothetical protein [Sphingobium wenxiniae]TWH93644.1 hypothetical protein IQ35_01853 [Sphingobium wenxiniae]WRD75548.1 hypothetical protein QQ987_12155 [Sphingobium baderi]
MEDNRNSELAEMTARIKRWIDDPAMLDGASVNALWEAVQQLVEKGRIDELLENPDADDDFIVEEATPHRSG